MIFIFFDKKMRKLYSKFKAKESWKREVAVAGWTMTFEPEEDRGYPGYGTYYLRIGFADMS